MKIIDVLTEFEVSFKGAPAICLALFLVTLSLTIAIGVIGKLLGR